MFLCSWKSFNANLSNSHDGCKIAQGASKYEITRSLQRSHQKYMRNHLRSCISTQNGRRRTRNNQNHTSFLSVIKTKLSCPSKEDSPHDRKDGCLLSKNVSTHNLLPSTKGSKIDLTEILRRAEKADPEILKNTILNRLLGLDQR